MTQPRADPHISRWVHRVHAPAGRHPLRPPHPPLLPRRQQAAWPRFIAGLPCPCLAAPHSRCACCASPRCWVSTNQVPLPSLEQHLDVWRAARYTSALSPCSILQARLVVWLELWSQVPWQRCCMPGLQPPSWHARTHCMAGPLRWLPCASPPHSPAGQATACASSTRPAPAAPLPGAPGEGQDYECVSGATSQPGVAAGQRGGCR